VTGTVVGRTAVVHLLVGTLLLSGCAGDVEPRVLIGVDACRECNMTIDTPGQACGFIEDGEFVTFDSPGCLLRHYEDRRKRGRSLPSDLHFADHADGTLHPVDTVTFLLTEHVPTVMESGVICFATRDAAEAAMRHEDEQLTDWQGYQLAHGVPDRVIEVQFEAGQMIPDIVEANKGELLLWMARSADGEQELRVAIRGYPEVGEIAIPSSGERVVFRMRTTRPGTGFPVVRAGTDDTLGMLRVVGAHTADEEAS
jgi:hypothetical protein